MPVERITAYLNTKSQIVRLNLKVCYGRQIVSVSLLYKKEHNEPSARGLRKYCVRPLFNQGSVALQMLGIRSVVRK